MRDEELFTRVYAACPDGAVQLPGRRPAGTSSAELRDSSRGEAAGPPASSADAGREELFTRVYAACSDGGSFQRPLSRRRYRGLSGRSGIVVVREPRRAAAAGPFALRLLLGPRP